MRYRDSNQKDNQRAQDLPVFRTQWTICARVENSAGGRWEFFCCSSRPDWLFCDTDVMSNSVQFCEPVQLFGAQAYSIALVMVACRQLRQ